MDKMEDTYAELKGDYVALRREKNKVHDIVVFSYLPIAIAIAIVIAIAICDLRFTICDLRFAICDLRFAIAIAIAIAIATVVGMMVAVVNGMKMIAIVIVVGMTVFF